jgi:hypothetical protein
MFEQLRRWGGRNAIAVHFARLLTETPWEQKIRGQGFPALSPVWSGNKNLTPLRPIGVDGILRPTPMPKLETDGSVFSFGINRCADQLR